MEARRLTLGDVVYTRERVLFAVMVIYNDLVKTLPGLAQRLP